MYANTITQKVQVQLLRIREQRTTTTPLACTRPDLHHFNPQLFVNSQQWAAAMLVSTAMLVLAEKSQLQLTNGDNKTEATS